MASNLKVHRIAVCCIEIRKPWFWQPCLYVFICLPADRHQLSFINDAASSTILLRTDILFLFFSFLLYLHLYFSILFRTVYLFIILSKGTSERSTGVRSLHDHNTCHAWSVLDSRSFRSPVEPFITYRLLYLRFYCFTHCTLVHRLRGLWVEGIST